MGIQHTEHRIQNTKAVSGNLADIFQKRLSQLGIKKQVDAALICEAFNDAIMEVFGEKGQKNVKAISYKDNMLKVGVSSSAWAQEVSLRQIELKQSNIIRIKYKIDEF
ncbi:DUF721 domain-containing protein [candidate division WS5 bacterium]|uniref:DUF721 domain-containing protein n=1 Tax=candidate division WS5 bacterium TaxID=2093353 RepID=A0A419DGJ2_9BACT|nr:MAG: DUF721 domain-containing protein [candidate division WS5 bacterium]